EAVIAAKSATGGPIAGPVNPRRMVPADLVHRPDDQWILADSLLDRRQLACLHQLSQLRCFLEALRKLGRIGDGGRTFQFPDELTIYLWRGCRSDSQARQIQESREADACHTGIPEQVATRELLLQQRHQIEPTAMTTSFHIR